MRLEAERLELAFDLARRLDDTVARLEHAQGGAELRPYELRTAATAVRQAARVLRGEPIDRVIPPAPRVPTPAYDDSRSHAPEARDPAPAERKASSLRSKGVVTPKPATKRRKLTFAPRMCPRCNRGFIPTGGRSVNCKRTDCSEVASARR